MYLHGVTDYGDAVEDEWLIVYILRELTRIHPSLWVCVFDSDGEFLLIEAANVLPKWLSPEMDRHRAWIHKGQLVIIPVADRDGSEPAPRNLSLQQAMDFVRSKPDSLVHSPFVEAEAFYRLEKYPEQAANCLHYSILSLPRNLATIVHAVPRAVAPAVEAFYLRDAFTMKPILTQNPDLKFPPDDLVDVSIRFTKVLFAQLRSQRFEAPPAWQRLLQKAQASFSRGGKHAARLEEGMKLTCGFEMLARSADKSRSRTVREFALTLDDVHEDGAEALPSNDEIATWTDIHRDDDEAWLDINYEDFERELEGKKSKVHGAPKAGFGDARIQADLRKIVSRFEAFLNDENAGVEGAELNEMDFDDDEEDDENADETGSECNSEDQAVSFDEEEFSRMMREMMGLAQERPQSSSKDKVRSKPITDPGPEKEEDQVIRDLTIQMEDELKAHGALKIDESQERQKRLTRSKPSAKDDGEGSQDANDEVDIDYNLARNLLESFKSQGGTPGPAGNILGMMGFHLPRDEDQGEEEDGDDHHHHT